MNYESSQGRGSLGALAACFCGTIESSTYLPFVIIWMIYFIDETLISPSLIVFGFIAIWIGFGVQFWNIWCSISDYDTTYYLLTHDDDDQDNDMIAKSIMINSISDCILLDKLNKNLELKRNHLNKQYRFRDNILYDIISPNHVSMDAKIYDSYIANINEGQYYNTGVRSTQLNILSSIDHNNSPQNLITATNSLLHENDNVDEIDIEYAFFQWVPTEFRLKFVNEHNKPNSFKEMNIDHLDIELASPYIPDVNQYDYPELNECIVLSLKQMFPLFAGSITCDRYGFSDNYKKLLFDWCCKQKKLKFIVKSQQHEFNKDNIGYVHQSRFHIEGTIQEKISYIGILYNDIDSRIKGGNFYLRFNIRNYKKDWKLKPRKGSMIVLPNIPHRIKHLSCWNCNDCVPQIRRTLSFFLLYDDEMQYYNETNIQSFEQSVTYKYMTIDGRDYDDDDIRWRLLNGYSNLPIITASQSLPIDGEHFDKLFENMLFKNVANVFQMDLPQIVVDIIKQYIISDGLLRDEETLHINAKKMRDSRGYGRNHFNQKIVFMN